MPCNRSFIFLFRIPTLTIEEILVSRNTFNPFRFLQESHSLFFRGCFKFFERIGMNSIFTHGVNKVQTFINLIGYITFGSRIIHPFCGNAKNISIGTHSIKKQSSFNTPVRFPIRGIPSLKSWHTRTKHIGIIFHVIPRFKKSCTLDRKHLTKRRNHSAYIY